MSHRWLRTGLQNTYHVEPGLFEVGLSLSQVLLGHGPDGLLLARRHGLYGLTECGVPSPLDLDEDQASSVAQNQVYLSITGAVVTLDQFVTLGEQPAQRQLLAAIPRGPIALAGQSRPPKQWRAQATS